MQIHTSRKLRESTCEKGKLRSSPQANHTATCCEQQVAKRWLIAPVANVRDVFIPISCCEEMHQKTGEKFPNQQCSNNGSSTIRTSIAGRYAPELEKKSPTSNVQVMVRQLIRTSIAGR